MEVGFAYIYLQMAEIYFKKQLKSGNPLTYPRSFKVGIGFMVLPVFLWKNILVFPMDGALYFNKGLNDNY